jgi:hypothetical protein
MRKRFGVRRPSPAVIIAIIALVFAFTGGAVAAKKLSLGKLSNGAKNKTVGVGKLTYVQSTANIAQAPPGDLGINPTALSAACPPGLRVIGGGIKVSNPNQAVVTQSYPTASGWAGTAQNFGDVAHTATTTAICAPSRVVTGAPPAS